MPGLTKSADARSRATCDGIKGNVRAQPNAVGRRRSHPHDDIGSSAPAADTHPRRIPPSAGEAGSVPPTPALPASLLSHFHVPTISALVPLKNGKRTEVFP